MFFYETAAHIPNEDAVGSDVPEGDTTKDFSLDFRKRLYTFQRKMAEPALKKQNTLLVSPTGTGKTHVAAYIIEHHLNELEAKKVRGKVVFIVPTVGLFMSELSCLLAIQWLLTHHVNDNPT